MLERIQRHDYVGAFVRCRHEPAAIGHALGVGVLACGREKRCVDIDADHPSGAPFRHLDRLIPCAAAEINYGSAANLIEERLPRSVASLLLCA